MTPKHQLRQHASRALSTRERDMRTVTIEREDEVQRWQYLSPVLNDCAGCDTAFTPGVHPGCATTY